MANTHTSLSSLFTAIANAIRSKTGGSGSIVADNFPNAISGITTLSDGTADATATAENIDAGATAYVKGVKLTGTSQKVDTNDANATEADIALGKTAYVAGMKKTGTAIVDNYEVLYGEFTKNYTVNGRNAIKIPSPFKGAGTTLKAFGYLLDGTNTYLGVYDKTLLYTNFQNFGNIGLTEQGDYIILDANAAARAVNQYKGSIVKE